MVISPMLLESVNLYDLPKDINVIIFPTKFFCDTLKVEITNNKDHTINLNVLGTVLTPSNPKYYSFIVCSFLNELLPESMLIKPKETFKGSLQVVLGEGFMDFPNKYVDYKVSNLIVNPKVINVIQRFLRARRKRYKCERGQVVWKHGEKTYFKLEHIRQSVQKIRNRLGSNFIINSQLTNKESEN